MGNVCKITLSCDAVLTRCLDCTVNRAAYINELEDNVDALRTERQKLIEARNDLLRKITAYEQRRMKRTDRVQGWLSRAEAEEAEVDKLIRDSPQEVDKLCLGGYCSKNCMSSCKFGKQVAKKLQDVKTLMGEVVFEVVPERDVVSMADERPIEPTVVGLESKLEDVWRCLVQEPAVSIVGLYGMGGVGKTRLLNQINNKFLEVPNSFELVIWVQVSRDLQLVKIQEHIGKRVGLVDDDEWKDKSFEEKALAIFKVLSKKKFVMLLDDIWKRVDLEKVGVPTSGNGIASKIVFTTRLLDVCGLMEAHRKFKLECLSDEEAWELFKVKVGEETLNCQHEIPELAKTVANECGGLPLALITIGRAMACKKRPGEWRYAIQVLRRAASEFPGLENDVYRLLKFSYDSLPNDKIRLCLLYCSLYSEDYSISKCNLIDCWIGEGFLDENYSFGDQGDYIIGILVHACLLEEVGEDKVKMHDVVRDMALWIACETAKNDRFLVYAGAGLSKLPGLGEWEEVRRLSLMQNLIKDLSEIPTCPHLLTLFLNHNALDKITRGFFDYMPSLKVLNLSHVELTRVPVGISMLVSLQHLDLSNSNITLLPEELIALENLICLNLENTRELHTIPRHLISNFSRLHVLRMFGSGCSAVRRAFEYSVLFGGGELLVEELLGLEYLQVLEFTLTTSTALQKLLSSLELKGCIQALTLYDFMYSRSIHASPLADLKQLSRLEIRECAKLEDLKIDFTGGVKKNNLRPCCFHSLGNVHIYSCPLLKDLTFLAFAPNLKSVFVWYCDGMEEIISVGKFVNNPEMVGNLNPFSKLQHLQLQYLKKLKSIYWKPLPFPLLKEMVLDGCYNLEKLPLDSNSAKNFFIRGPKNMCKNLRWEDEATQNAFLPCFK